MKYKIEPFSQPITKSYQDVKKYDVARFEYGDDDNWVNAIILNLTPEKNGRVIKIEFENSIGQHFIAYGYTLNDKLDFDIIGTASEAKKEQGSQR